MGKVGVRGLLFNPYKLCSLAYNLQLSSAHATGRQAGRQLYIPGCLRTACNLAVPPIASNLAVPPIACNLAVPPLGHLSFAGVLDPSEYPGWDEDEGGALANVDADVGLGLPPPSFSLPRSVWADQ